MAGREGLVKMSERRRNSTAGITMPQLLVVIGVLGVVVLAVTIPNFVRARATRSYSPCIAHLKQIDGAKEQWALENKKTAGAPVDAAEVNTYLKNSTAPKCPQGGTYTYNPVGKAPTCSLGATLGHTI
jgi:competence protein ComGC